MSENIGAKIKQLRTDADLTWGDIAEAAGIEVSQLALIESGEATPSIATLIKISRRLGVRVGTLLDGTEAEAPMVTNIDSLQPTINTNKPGCCNNLDFFSLAGNKYDRNMEPFYINISYIDNEEKNYSDHEGEEFIFVLEGTVELFYGADSYTINKNESIYYDSIVPHLVRSADKESDAKVLAVTYSPN